MGESDAGSNLLRRLNGSRTADSHAEYCLLLGLWPGHSQLRVCPPSWCPAADVQEHRVPLPAAQAHRAVYLTLDRPVRFLPDLSRSRSLPRPSSRLELRSFQNVTSTFPILGLAHFYLVRMPYVPS